MSLTLKILPRAERDAQAIYDYIYPRSEAGAIHWWQAFQKAMHSLPENPMRYGLAPENELSHLKIQQFLFRTPHGRTYRGVFVAVEEEIRVLRVRGPGQAKLSANEMPLE